MKKLLALLFALSAVMQAMAYDFQATMTDGRVLYFNVLSNTECEVSRMYYTERNAGYVSGSLVIPSTVKDSEGTRYTVVGIGKSAFVHCRNLTSVTVPGTVYYIGNAAFQNCKGLTTVVLPDALQTIGDEAFEDCISLTELTIPRSVKTIGIEVFEDCDALKSLYVKSDEPANVTSSSFPLTNGRVPFTLYVPYGSYSRYRNANYWNAFMDIREEGNMPNSYADTRSYNNSNYQQNNSSYQQNNSSYQQNNSNYNQNDYNQNNYNQNDYYEGGDEVSDLQRQVIDLQQQNSRLKDAIYRALFSSNYEECKRVLRSVVSE